MGREIEVVDEVIKKVSAGELHPEIARIAIKGSIVELMDAHEAEIRAKDERIAGLKKALKLAEAKPQKKVVKVLDDVSFEELETIEKLAKTKKLTDKQREAIKSLLKYYYSRDYEQKVRDR